MSYRPQRDFGGGMRGGPYGGQQQNDPMKVSALEQLLRTVAEKAQTMRTEEILALNAAFAVASSSSTTPPERALSALGASVQSSRSGTTSSAAFLDPLLQLLQGQQSPRHQPALASSSSASAAPLPTLEEVGGGLNTVRVSSKAPVKSIAGAMSKSLRNNEMICATAVGPDGCNHGMKALSIARCYLAADGFDLSATVVEVQPDAAMNSPGQCFAFVVVRIVVPAKTGEPLCEAGVGRTEPLPRFVRPEGHQTDMRVSGSGNAATLGGALAKCLREDREIIVTAIGPASVAKCVEALALARGYVWADGLQLAFYPGFEHIIMAGGGPGAGESRSAVKVHVWPELAPGGGGQGATGAASAAGAVQVGQGYTGGFLQQPL
mmetsp:Transcript_81623/g.205384  ORF Transcript_81623/g.205384 Transcript_81623/m.205384 type:complete len:378 (-) Transcript_81623:60-1193(-)